MPDYSKITFPRTAPIPLENLLPDAHASAHALFKRFIKYDAAKRVAARDALLDEYFHIPPLPPTDLREMPVPGRAEGGRKNPAGGAADEGTARENRIDAASFHDLCQDLIDMKY